MNKEAFIHGIYPQAEELIEANRGIDKGRVTEQELFRAQTHDLFNLVELQKQEGLVFTEDGKFKWKDIFRPLVDSADGLDEGPLTRWFDTNTFFRQPIISSTPQFNRKRFNRYIAQFSGIDQKITLPSPFTFAKLCDDKLDNSFDSTLGVVSDFLGSIVQYLSEQGIKAIQLNEPYLPYSGAGPDDIGRFLKSIRQIGNMKRQNTKLFLHLNFGDGADVLRAIDDTDINIDAVGVDFYKTRLSTIPTNISRPLIAGVINSQASTIEDVDMVGAFVEKVTEHASPTTLYLTHTADLEYVPGIIAEQKVRLLGELSK